ncbi:hypothetical protein ACIPPM_15180 [Streptomyces sp. NPDC090119]|uniref:hypothetical protein n=1 Tax=Streptomyces sp. NPDC090119 TaxID=3365951 RepID=UPI003815AF04
MSKRLILLYAAVLGALSVAAAVPVDAIAHPAITAWTFAAMPSSVLMTVAWMAASTLLPPTFTPGPALSALLTLTFHLSAAALQTGALLLLRKACSKCRTLACA